MDTLFPMMPPVLSDDEIAVILRRAICGRSGRGSCEADLFLATISTERIIDELRLAGAVVMLRPSD